MRTSSWASLKSGISLTPHGVHKKNRLKSGLGARSIRRIHEHGNTNGLRHQVMQEPQPLGHHLQGEKIDAGRVAAGPGEAGDKTKPNRVFGDTEDLAEDRRGGA